MSIVKIDMNFCRQMADVARYPDQVAPRRPEGRSVGHRIKAAWLVLTGKADALVWP